MDKEKLTQKVIAFSEGNQDAFSDIYEMTKNNFFAYALFLANDQNSAEELLQDTYIKILQSIDTLKDPAAFTSWSKAILRNTAMQKYRRMQKETVYTTDEGELFNELEEKDSAFLPGEEFDREEVRQIIIQIINSLSAEQKMAILSFYYDEMTVKEIAEVMDCSEGTVKSRLFNGRKAIKEGIEKYEKEHDIRLHAAVPAGLLFSILKDLDAVCDVPASVSRKIFRSAAKLKPVHADTAIKTAKAASISGIGTSKIVSLVLVAVLAVGGIGYGVKQLNSAKAESDAVETENTNTEEQVTDKKDILDAYSSYFSEKAKELKQIEEEESSEGLICAPAAQFIDEDADNLPDAIIFYPAYKSALYTICTYVDGHIAELYEEDFIPSKLYYGVEARISSDKKEIVLIVREDSETEVLAGRFILEGDKYILKEKDTYDESTMDQLEDSYAMENGKSYSTSDEDFHFFESTSDFIDCLSHYDIIPGEPGSETDWKTAYGTYFSELKESLYFDDNISTYLAAHDVNGDGIPEIFIDRPMIKNAFSFIDGKVQAIQDPETGYSDASARLYFDEDTAEICYFNSTGTIGVPALFETFKIGSKGFQMTNKMSGYFHLDEDELESQFNGYPPLAAFNWADVEVSEITDSFEVYDIYNKDLSGKVEIHSKEDFAQFFKDTVGVTLQ